MKKRLPSRKQRTARKNEVLTEIEDLIDTNPNGQYTHNIISCLLRGLAEETDVESANEVIEELCLTELYSIYPVNTDNIIDHE